MTDKFLAFKWRTLRICPNRGPMGFDNSTEIKSQAQHKITSLDEWIEKELDVQEDILRNVGSDQELAKKALDALRTAYESAWYR